METRLTYTYWKDEDYVVGCLNDYPDDSTQGLTMGELEEALKEVYEIRQEEKRHSAPNSSHRYFDQNS